jgi:hypothetical protein
MSSTSRIETREIADAELDGIAGGLSVTGTLEGVDVTGTQGPGGVPVVHGTAKSAGLTVKDIPLGTTAVTG